MSWLVRVRGLRFTLGTLWLAVVFAVSSQCQGKPATTISGVVYDAAHAPVSSAQVTLQTPDGAGVQSAQTDAAGHFEFRSITAGSYRLHAEASDLGEGDSNSFSLVTGQNLSFDLKLSPKNKTNLEFFDHPTFAVAGVTDTTNLGGHGSDTVTRTKQSLAKEVVGLPSTERKTTPLTGKASALRDTADHHPSDFNANTEAGQQLLKDGHAAESILYLERAKKLEPARYENAFALAKAYTETGDVEKARPLVSELLSSQNLAELHNLLGTIEERSGNPVEAERQYQTAARMNPTEANFFDWGAELLLHHAPDAATDVFTEGARRFPISSRLLTALGVSWYIRGSYNQAFDTLSRASELNPNNPTPYMFIGHILTVESSLPQATSERISRFLQQAPNNPWTNYLAALDLWKRTHASRDPSATLRVQSLLSRAIDLDPKFALAHFQRGVVCTELSDYAGAIAALQKAIESDPSLSDAHYRLGQLYRRMGNEAEARHELSLYEQLTASQTAKAQLERHEIQQFVISSRSPESPKSER